VVTGAPAAERPKTDAGPARHLPLRPDVLRRERERIAIAESRRIIEQALEQDPERLAELIAQLLEQDRDGATPVQGAT